jgi:hypothetical protein
VMNSPSMMMNSPRLETMRYRKDDPAGWVANGQ